MTPHNATPADVVAIAAALEQVFFAAVGVTAVALNKARASQELTLAQWRALVLLRRPGGVRVGELANGLDMSLPSASRLVVRMERRGLVTTTRDDEDRRATLVRATPHGEGVRQTVIRTRQALLQEVLARHAGELPAGTDRGLDAVARALTDYR